MIYYRDTKEISLPSCSVTLGNFDGIHIGHQLLVKAMKERIPDDCLKVMFSFDLDRFREKSLLTEEERRTKAERLGLDVFILWPFDSATKNMLPEEFIRDILKNQLHVNSIVVGDDFYFGRGRSGNVETLVHFSGKYDYEVVCIDKLKWKNEVVSSTRIRKDLEAGLMEDVSVLLGEEYRIEGQVIHGLHLGHSIGIPTINVPVPGHKLTPPNGVYSSVTKIDGLMYPGVSNLGIKPSVTDNGVLGLETYLFDSDNDFYGKNVSVSLKSFLRPEQKFENLEELKKQIHMDCESAKQLLS